jgi:hypothetical protein
MAVVCPFGFVERVAVAYGFVEGRVLLHAVDFVDLEAFLVEENVKYIVYVDCQLWTAPVVPVANVQLP